MYFNKWAALAKHKVLTYIHYRSFIFLWMLSGLTPLIMMFAWVDSLSEHPSKLVSQTFVYFSLVFLFRQLSTCWVSEDLSASIRNGDLASRVLRPVPVWWEHAAAYFGGGVMRAAPAIFICMVIIFSTQSWAEIDIENCFIGGVSFLIAWMIVFAIGWLVGSLSFWISEIKIVSAPLSSITFCFGGAIGPLTMFPEAIKGFIIYMPFPSILAAPISMFLPRFDLYGGPVNTLFVQIIWLAVFVLLATGVWVVGLKAHKFEGQ